MDSPDGLSLMIGGSAVGAIATLLGAWIKAKYSRTKIDPQPLEVRESELSQIVKDNSNEHKNFEFRLAKLERELAAIDERTASTNERLDRIENKLDRLIERITNE